MSLFTGKKELAAQLLGFSSSAPPPLPTNTEMHRYIHTECFGVYKLPGHLSA